MLDSFFQCIQNLGLVFLAVTSSNQVYISKCSGDKETSQAGEDNYNLTLTEVLLQSQAC